MTLVMGVDVGGTSTKVLLARTGGAVPEEVQRSRWPTPRSGPELADLAARLADWAGPLRPARVGVSVPGVLAPDGRSLTVSVNLPGLVGQPLAEVLAAPCAAAGEVLNDGDAAARAEVALGAARGERDVFVIALGTGVAGAHVVDGRVRRGAHGAAGEVGHVATGSGRRCSCGQRGCLETSVGGVHLAARWQEVTGLPGLTAEDLVTAARGGDGRALALLEAATDHLAAVLLATVAVLDPGVVVVGGGLAQAVDLVVEPTARKLAAAATFHHVPPVLAAELGPWAGAWGAALPTA